MTIEELRQLQDREGLRDVHVVEIHDDGFVLAHADYERTAARITGGRLEDCAVHQWLASRDVAPAEAGVYRLVRRLPDPVSESYRGDAAPWDLVALELQTT